MKIWILHDSIYGNGEKLARILANHLSKKHVVKVGYVCNIAPESLVAENPDMIIFGSAIRFGVHSINVKHWFRRYTKIMKEANRKLSYTFLYYTHLNPPRKIRKQGSKALEVLKKSNIIQNIFEECVSAQVVSIEGPLCEGVEDKFSRIAELLDAWLNGAQVSHLLKFNEENIVEADFSRYLRFLRIPNPRSNKLF